MADGWVPQPHYTDGEIVLFLEGHELVEVRMNDTSVTTAVRAANSLNARFFFRRVAYDRESMTYTWAAYDRHDFSSRGGTTTWSGQPRKTFKTNDTAPLLMWGVARSNV